MKHQISGTAIGTKFTPPYACIYMGNMENQGLKNEQIQLWICFRCTDIYIYIYFLMASGKELDEFGTTLQFPSQFKACVRYFFVFSIFFSPNDSP